MDNENAREQLISKLEQLQKELADLKNRWPAHSVKPSMLVELEGLEEKIQQISEKLQIPGRPKRDRINHS